MIAPLPQFPLPPQPGQPGPLQPQAPGVASDLFVQMLAAAAETNLPVESAVALPAPALPNSAPAPDQPSDKNVPAPIASVFNQFGFFGHAEAFDPAPGTRAVAVARETAPACCDTRGRLVDALPERGPPGPLMVRFEESAAEGSDIADAPRAAAPRPAPTPQLFVAEGAPAVQDIETEPACSVETRPTIRHAAPAAYARVEVALHELEQGLHVAARVDGLDETDRVRMREEIGALLSEHGLFARSVRIGGRPASRTDREGNSK